MTVPFAIGWLGVAGPACPCTAAKPYTHEQLAEASSWKIKYAAAGLLGQQSRLSDEVGQQRCSGCIPLKPHLL